MIDNLPLLPADISVESNTVSHYVVLNGLLGGLIVMLTMVNTSTSISPPALLDNGILL